MPSGLRTNGLEMQIQTFKTVCGDTQPPCMDEYFKLEFLIFKIVHFQTHGHIIQGVAGEGMHVH